LNGERIPINITIITVIERVGMRDTIVAVMATAIAILHITMVILTVAGLEDM